MPVGSVFSHRNCGLSGLVTSSANTSAPPWRPPETRTVRHAPLICTSLTVTVWSTEYLWQ